MEKLVRVNCGRLVHASSCCLSGLSLMSFTRKNGRGPSCTLGPRASVPSEDDEASASGPAASAKPGSKLAMQARLRLNNELRMGSPGLENCSGSDAAAPWLMQPNEP